MLAHIGSSIGAALPGGGGALEIGGIGIFDADPGSGYQQPKGQLLFASEYPDLAAKLNKSRGPIQSSGIGSFSPRGGISPQGKILISGNDVAIPHGQGANTYLRSVDRGANFSPVDGGVNGVAYIAEHPGTNIWIAVSASVGLSSGGGVRSADRGVSWGVLSNGSTAIGQGLKYLGAPLNLMVTWTAAGVVYQNGAASGQWVTLFQASPAYTNMSAIEINPNTGTIITVGSTSSNNLIQRRTSAGVLSTAYTFSGSGGVDVVYANGMFVVSTAGNGVFVSTDDGLSWTQKLSGDIRTLDYANGIWVLGTGSAATYSVADAGLNTATVMTISSSVVNTNSWASIRYGNGRWFFTKANTGAVLYTPDADPSTEYFLLPYVGDEALLSPRKNYMKVK